MSKKVEAKGYEYLVRHVRENCPGAILTPTMNKGRGKNVGIADAVLNYDDDKKVHIEIKASSKALGTNIRFTHQTIAKALGHDLIVAIIDNLANQEETKIRFFRLGAVQESILVEPHFIVQKASVASRTDTLRALLKSKAIPLSLSELLKTEVGKHVGPQDREPG